MNNLLATVLSLVTPQFTPVFRLTMPVGMGTQGLLKQVDYTWVSRAIASGLFATPGAIDGRFWARYMLFKQESITAAEVESCAAEQQIGPDRWSLALPEHVFVDALHPNNYNQNRPIPALGVKARIGDRDYVVCSTCTPERRTAFIQDASLDWRHAPAFLIVCPSGR